MRQRIAQMLPMDPSMMGAPPMGAPPMGAPPMGAAPMGAPPMGGPMPPPPGKEPLTGPLKGVGDILRDAGIEELVAANPNATDEELADKVWAQYGGDADGGVDPKKVGERAPQEEPPAPEETEAELKDTVQERWKRLPMGKTIGDIMSLGELQEMMKPVIFGAVKKLSTPPAPPGGGMPPMASVIGLHMMRLADRMYPDARDLADRLASLSRSA